MTATKRADPPERSILTGIYYTLRQQSARTNKPRGQDLRSGARLTVRVNGNTVTVIIARPVKPLGGTEIETFKAHCAVPVDAERAPADGSQQVIEVDNVAWHRVAWRWSDATE